MDDIRQQKLQEAKEAKESKEAKNEELKESNYIQLKWELEKIKKMKENQNWEKQKAENIEDFQKSNKGFNNNASSGIIITSEKQKNLERNGQYNKNQRFNMIKNSQFSSCLYDDNMYPPLIVDNDIPALSLWSDSGDYDKNDYIKNHQHENNKDSNENYYY